MRSMAATAPRADRLAPALSLLEPTPRRIRVAAGATAEQVARAERDARAADVFAGYPPVRPRARQPEQEQEPAQECAPEPAVEAPPVDPRPQTSEERATRREMQAWFDWRALDAERARKLAETPRGPMLATTIGNCRIEFAACLTKQQRARLMRRVERAHLPERRRAARSKPEAVLRREIAELNAAIEAARGSR